MKRHLVAIAIGLTGLAAGSSAGEVTFTVRPVNCLGMLLAKETPVRRLRGCAGAGSASAERWAGEPRRY